MFDRPQRQHALGLLILIGWQAQALVRSTWPVFVAFYFQGDRDARFFIWAIGAGCALTFLGAVLHFARFTFHLEADQLHVRKGVLVRDKVNIPLDRVQAVHVEQNLLQRLFKVCGLKIDTAGSAGSELVIHALPWDDAHALRSRLLQSAQVTTAGVEDEPRPGDTDTPNLVAALDTATLLKVGLSQNHLSKIGFAIGGLLTFQGVAWEVMAELWQQVPSLYRTVLLFLSPLLLVLSPVVIAAVSVLISVATSVVKHWKLRVWVEADEDPTKRALHLTQGLLNRQRMQVPLHKVQWVMWESTWIRRQFGFDTLHVRQASAGGAEPSSGGPKLTIPAVDGTPTRSFEGLVFPTWPERRLVTLRPMAYAFWMRWLKRTLLWSPLALLAAWNFGWVVGLTALGGCAAWTWLWARAWHRGMWATTDGRHVSVHRGWLFRKRIMVDWTKLQAVQFTQNRIQARRGVAHLTFHTASGVAVLPYLPTSTALQIRDLACAQVNGHSGAWM